MTFKTRATIVLVAVLVGTASRRLRAAPTRSVHARPGAAIARSATRDRRRRFARFAPRSPPTSESSGAIRRAATPTTPCGRAASSRAWRGSASATRPTGEQAYGSSSSCSPDIRRARSLSGVDEALARFESVKVVPTLAVAPTRHSRAPPASAVAAASGRQARPTTAEPVPAGVVTVRGITRTALPDGVRVSIEMDRELLFKQERLENPRRIFFDLRGAHLSPGLRDKTFSFSDDIVREIRVGRHPQNTTRVVMDTEGVESYSVFTLYNPYRVIVDFRRRGALPPPRAARARAAGLGRRPDDRLRCKAEPKPVPPPPPPPPAPIVVHGAAADAAAVTSAGARPFGSDGPARELQRSVLAGATARASASRASCSTPGTAATIPACAATA